MTQQEQRIAIAEWMGWTNISQYENSIWGTPPQGLPERKGGMAVLDFETDDYPNDLNAMHEAEKKLGDWTMPMEAGTLVDKYLLKLVDVCSDAQPEIYYVHATSAQRSEALCRTLFPERFK